jgi:undecaprenyl-phosphate 4-deoxy-4-formamido-L-arabinose transferase
MPPADPPDYSVVVTCYNEEHTIREFVARLVATTRAIDATFEIVIVDDGSADRTREVLREIFYGEPAVSAVVELYRNSGQAAAITAALQECRGANVVLIDSDLQLDPEELPKLLAVYDADTDLVTGYRPDREDPLLRRFYSYLANTMMRAASRKDVRDFGCTFKVLRGDLVRALGYGPTNVFNLVQVFEQIRVLREVPVSHHPRRHGRSGWTLAKLIRLNVDNLLNLSRRPFEWLGVLTAIAALLLILRIVVAFWWPKAFLEVVTTGLLLNAVVIALLITTTIQVILGELAMRNFDLARRQPAYIVRRRLTRDAADA